MVEIEEIQVNIPEAPLPASAAFPTSPIPSSLSVPTDVMPSQVYGPEHLLRLFGKISQRKVLSGICVWFKEALSRYCTIIFKS